jgi:hypothetical protein
MHFLGARARLRVACLAVVVGILAAALPVRAQLFEDAAGYPLRRFTVSLRRGHTYAFYTDGVSGRPGSLPSMQALPGAVVPPDSVLTLTSLVADFGSGGDHTVTTVAGADGSSACVAGGAIEPSCFLFTVPGPNDGTSVDYSLFLRAWQTYTPGRTNVYAQNVTLGT